jgi:hypothetical protein
VPGSARASQASYLDAISNYLAVAAVALAAAVDLAAVLVAARKGRSPGQGDQGFLRRNFQKKQLSEIGSLSLR